MMRHVILCSMLTLCCLPFCLGQEEDQPEVRVEGSRFFMVRDSVLISYYLDMPEQATALVSIELRRDDDSSFSLIPKSLTGAIGSVRGPGQKVILWDYRKDVPKDFESGGNYRFRVTATMESHETPWWVYALAGTGAAVGAAILIGVGGDDNTPPDGSTGLPGPPHIRPDQ